MKIPNLTTARCWKPGSDILTLRCCLNQSEGMRRFLPFLVLVLVAAVAFGLGRWSVERPVSFRMEGGLIVAVDGRRMSVYDPGAKRWVTLPEVPE